MQGFIKNVILVLVLSLCFNLSAQEFGLTYDVSVARFLIGDTSDTNFYRIKEGRICFEFMEKDGVLYFKPQMIKEKSFSYGEIKKKKFQFLYKKRFPDDKQVRYKWKFENSYNDVKGIAILDYIENDKYGVKGVKIVFGGNVTYYFCDSTSELITNLD